MSSLEAKQVINRLISVMDKQKSEDEAQIQTEQHQKDCNVNSECSSSVRLANYAYYFNLMYNLQTTYHVDIKSVRAGFKHEVKPLSKFDTSSVNCTSKYGNEVTCSKINDCLDSAERQTSSEKSKKSPCSQLLVSDKEDEGHNCNSESVQNNFGLTDVLLLIFNAKTDLNDKWEKFVSSKEVKDFNDQIVVPVFNSLYKLKVFVDSCASVNCTLKDGNEVDGSKFNDCIDSAEPHTSSDNNKESPCSRFHANDKEDEVRNCNAGSGQTRDFKTNLALLVNQANSAGQKIMSFLKSKEFNEQFLVPAGNALSKFFNFLAWSVKTTLNIISDALAINHDGSNIFSTSREAEFDPFLNSIRNLPKHKFKIIKDPTLSNEIEHQEDIWQTVYSFKTHLYRNPACHFELDIQQVQTTNCSEGKELVVSTNDKALKKIPQTSSTNVKGKRKSTYLSWLRNRLPRDLTVAAIIFAVEFLLDHLF